ncbi:MAG: N-acetylmuramoyl-L-alanine amidase [Alcanivoracaceae bacterium]|nr:N-acetylmuramoyl-L-alanine amidase [Alcanivoracaceae bacterium]
MIIPSKAINITVSNADLKLGVYPKIVTRPQKHLYQLAWLILLFIYASVHANPNELNHLNYFKSAYHAYPNIPAGYLEAMAFVNTRWQHIIPDKSTDHGHHERPQAIGIMGLRNGEYGYVNQVNVAAQALGIQAQDLIDSAELNILATAALISKQINHSGYKKIKLEDMAEITTHMLGRSIKQKSSQISDFIAASQFYDLLLTLDRGQDDHGVFILDKAIKWEQAFEPTMLMKLKAPVIRMNPKTDKVIVPGLEINVLDETYQSQSNDKVASPDYADANWIASPYHGTRSQVISAVAIHTTQGSYAGTLNWFQNNPSSVSAHYVIRSSDGQVTQMVREYRRAHHIGVHNSATLGIEHEGFVDNPAWYTSAMYNASANLTKHFCQSHNIDCASAYSGAAHNGVVVLSTSIKVKGHQHYSSQSHTDPGINWNWSQYYDLINGSSPSVNLNLDDFEQNEGHFNTTPSYSGSTTGISTASFAERTSAIKHGGSYSEHVQLRDNTNSSANWSVRLLSGSGSTSNNLKLGKSGGYIGFWILATGSGMRVAIGVDDSDGTERSDSISLNTNQWTYVEWQLDDSTQWNTWYNGNGVINSDVSIDAIWLFRNQTSYTVNMYIDDVQYRSGQ